MNKSDIVEKIARDGEVAGICKKIANGNDLWQDLYQEVLLNLLKYPEEKISGIYDKGYMKWFIVRMITNMYRSTPGHRSKFYYELQRFSDTIDDNCPADFVDEEVEYSEESTLVEKKLDAKPFYQRELYKLYMTEGSISKVHRKTKIPYNSVYHTCRDLEKEIRNDLRTYKVLFETPENPTGIHYYRQLVPHYYLRNNNPEFELTKTNSVDGLSYDQLKEFQMVQFSRFVSTDTLDRCKQMGIKTVIDIDDYWSVPATHLLADQYKQHNIPKVTTEALKMADHVTTTTEHFADIIKEFNTNVTVLPNAIDPDQPQFKITPTESERIRFGWMGGIFHREDIESLQPSFERLSKDPVRHDIQICLGGFNVMDTTGGMYAHFENIFTNNYGLVSGYGGYKEYLKTYSEDSNNVAEDKPYKRIWAKNIYSYALGYNEFDVALAPLLSNKFNSCKSQLKIIEAGFMKKAVIASDVMPYTIDCNASNSILINPNRNKIDWFVEIKNLASDRERVKDLGEALYETVKDKYHIKTVNKTRVELYKKIME